MSGPIVTVLTGRVLSVLIVDGSTSVDAQDVSQLAVGVHSLVTSVDSSGETA
jgi:hypothetical protein